MHMFMVVLVSLALRTITGALWLPSMPAPHITYYPAFALQDDTYITLYASPSAGACDPDNRRACALYALVAMQFYVSEDRFVGRALSFSEVLAVTYAGECFYRDNICADAIFRGFFDRQSGACPLARDCEPEYLLRWLSGMGHWIQSVEMSDDGRYVRVNMRRLTGDRDGRQTGYRYYRDWLDALVMRRLRWVRTGRGPTVPSNIGNVCVHPGETVEGVFSQRVVGTCGPDGGMVNVFVVTSTEARVRVIGRE